MQDKARYVCVCVYNKNGKRESIEIQGSNIYLHISMQQDQLCSYITRFYTRNYKEKEGQIKEKECVYKCWQDAYTHPHPHTHIYTNKNTEQALATDTNVTVGPTSPSPPLYNPIQFLQGTNRTQRGRGQGCTRVEFTSHTQSMIIVCLYMSLRGALELFSA